MRPESSKLTPEQRQNFQDHINKKMSLIGKCPVCSSRSWILMEHFIQTPLFHADGNTYLGSGTAYPFVGLMCSNCGNTQFINAVVSGVLPAKIGTSDASPTKKAEGVDGE